MESSIVWKGDDGIAGMRKRNVEVVKNGTDGMKQ